ncbi:MAG: PAS domain-containing protein [Candidatus Delongbacteria bacterium]|nr:PAS domain-containing protein [Candidatus Delongbacteria bacterium]
MKKTGKDKFNDLIESLSEGISTVDENENITYINRSGSQLLGGEVIEILGMNLGDFITNDHLDLVQKGSYSKKIAGTEYYTIDITGLDNVDRTLLVKRTPVLDENGNYKGSLGLFTDISEKIKIKDEQDDMIKKLKHNDLSLNISNSEFLPICACCNRIRDGHDKWHPVADYLAKHTDLQFTHSLCPACKEDFYGINKK